MVLGGYDLYLLWFVMRVGFGLLGFMFRVLMGLLFICWLDKRLGSAFCGCLKCFWFCGGVIDFDFDFRALVG